MSSRVFTCGADYGNTMAFLKHFLLMNSWVQFRVNQFSTCNNLNIDLLQIKNSSNTLRFSSDYELENSFAFQVSFNNPGN